MTSPKQNKHSRASRSTVKNLAMLDLILQSPAGKRRIRAAQTFFRRWLKEASPLSGRDVPRN